ncbi:MAG: hypothetical protein M0R05_01780 [Bacilli bacterium]|nr:hypothetical protein [Bacilli bacterium]MDD4076371.1 hypothetical protein [Bacilli bacterium]MDD4388270.1 hypothetical protein [Bacilli bacterium]
MKKTAVLMVIVGLILLIGTFFISAYSENLPALAKTVGFVLLGYLGLAFFAFGWMLIYNRKKK